MSPTVGFVPGKSVDVDRTIVTTKKGDIQITLNTVTKDATFTDTKTGKQIEGNMNDKEFLKQVENFAGRDIFRQIITWFEEIKAMQQKLLGQQTPKGVSPAQSASVSEFRGTERAKRTAKDVGDAEEAGKDAFFRNA